jgi:hypothetical protein
MENPHLLEEQAAARAGQPGPASRDRQILARTAADHDVDAAQRGDPPLVDLRHIAEIGGAG